MDRMKTPGAEAPVDRGGAKPQIRELTAGHDTALPAGDLRDRPVDDEVAPHTDD
jgi:hypothetical protein